MEVRHETKVWAGFALTLLAGIVMGVGGIRDLAGANGSQDQIAVAGSLAMVLISLTVAVLVHRESKLRRATERELRASESRLRSIIDNTSAVIFVKDLSGKYLLVNRAYAELMGMESGEMVGKTAFDLFPQATAEVLRKNDLRVIAGDSPSQVEEQAIVGGQVRTFLSSKFALEGPDGNCLSLCGIATDITERKKFEQRLAENEELLRLALDGGKFAVWRITLPDNTLIVSDRFKEILGLRVDVDLDIATAWKTVHPDDLKRIEAEQLASISEGRNFDAEYRIVWPDGSVHWVYAKGSTSFDAEGKPTSIQGVKTEITQRRRIESEIAALNEELRRQMAQLDASNQELEAFSYSVSHDLRAPLRSIDGFSRALLEDYSGALDQTGQDFLNRVCSSAVRMGQLIDDLLSLARVTRQDLNYQEVDLSEMANAIAIELEQTNPDRVVTFSIEPGIWATGDRHLLRIVLYNLLENAWKYSSRNERAQIRFGAQDKGEGRAFYVSDNGAGFDMTYAAKLFQPFERLHTRREFEGTGIGLATVRKVLRRHGGEIWAKGEVDAGATFFFTLESKGGLNERQSDIACGGQSGRCHADTASVAEEQHS